MEREIKFRVWDLEINQYRNNGTISISGNGKPFIISKLGKSLPKIEYLDNLILEQFTGLKDKNGKYIYEGDVVQGYKCHFTVKYINGAFMWGNEFLGYNICGNYDCGYDVEETEIKINGLKVIGNIHEKEV